MYAMVGVYSLTGAVSSSSDCNYSATNYSLVHDAMSKRVQVAGMSFLNMVHHHMEITEIERLQIVSSLVHSSLIAHCSYRLKFLKDSFLSNCRRLSIVGLDHVQSPR